MAKEVKLLPSKTYTKNESNIGIEMVVQYHASLQNNDVCKEIQHRQMEDVEDNVTLLK